MAILLALLMVASSWYFISKAPNPNGINKLLVYLIALCLGGFMFLSLDVVFAALGRVNYVADAFILLMPDSWLTPDSVVLGTQPFTSMRIASILNILFFYFTPLTILIGNTILIRGLYITNKLSLLDKLLRLGLALYCVVLMGHFYQHFSKTNLSPQLYQTCISAPNSEGCIACNENGDSELCVICEDEYMAAATRSTNETTGYEFSEGISQNCKEI